MNLIYWIFSSKTVILIDKFRFMITKEMLYKQIESLPDQLNIEELIEKLLLIEKIESRIIESDNDDTLSEECLEDQIQTWSN